MKATPGEKVLEHGKVKYIVYTNKNKDETMTVRVIIDKLFKLSDMDDLKIVFLLHVIPNSSSSTIEVLSEYVEKYGDINALILTDIGIINPFFKYDSSNYIEQHKFKKQCMNIGFCNVIWCSCIPNSASTQWIIFGNAYAREWMSTRVYTGEGPSDGKIIRRIIEAESGEDTEEETTNE